jgi:ABC-type transport system substrate-binding protein
MGVVYLARDPSLDRQVAVKVVTPSRLTPESEERFRREARLVAKIDHPAIVPVHDVGEEDESLFLVMPYVEGWNLRVLMDQHSLKMGDLIEIGIQTAEALAYSHSQNIIHRDIKPENILISPQPDGSIRVRITDFGLATANSETRLTQSGAVVGTIAYLSPEQVSGLEADSRADIYALGTVLYECVTGETPFTGEFQSVLYRIAHEAATPPRALAEIDRELERVILWCLEKEPGARPQTGREIAMALTALRASLVSEEREKLAFPGAQRETGRYYIPPAMPFIAREKELTELQSRLNLAVAGECQFVMIGGEAGIGKSRLMEELETLALVRKIRVLHGRFFEQDRAFPYEGLCGLIQEYFRISKSSNSSESIADFSDLATDLVSLFPVLSELQAFRSVSTGEIKPGPDILRLSDRTYIFELLARCLTRIAGGRPLVVFLEDLHNGEVSIDALQYIVRRLGPTSTLIVGSFRTNEVDRAHPLMKLLDSFSGDRRFVHIPLSRFTPAEHEEFVRGMTTGFQLSKSVSQKLYEATEGNAYFTQELLRSLMDASTVGKSDRSVLLSESDLATAPLPATIQQTIEKRIRKLPDSLKEFLSVASVLGKSFEVNDLEALVDEKETVDDLLDRLIREGLLLEESESLRLNRLRFSSSVVRDVLYASLSRRRRKVLHLRYAEELEKRHSGHLERVYPQLLHHYSHADVPARVVEYGLKFAKKSLQAFSPEDAIRATKMVLDFGDGLLEGEARSLLSAAYRMSGEFEEALREQELTIRVFERTGDLPRAAAAMYAGAEMAWQFRKIEQTKRWVDRGMDLARSAGEFETLHKLLSLAATVSNLRGEYAKAAAYFEEAQRLRNEEKQPEDLPRGGKLVVALPARVQAVCPAMVTLAEEVEVLSSVFEPLLATDAHGNLIPWLCERWDVLEGGKAFLLTLRPNVRFHDGRAFSATEVKKCIERAIQNTTNDPPQAFAAIEGVAEYRKNLANHVQGLVVISQNKIAIRLKESLPIYPSLLAAMRTEIAASVDEAQGARHVGTGPFRFQKFQPDRVILERNPNYWRSAPPLLDFVEFRAVASSAEIAAGILSGEFDLAGDLLPTDLEKVLTDRRLRPWIVETPKKNVYFLVFNAASPKAQKEKLREALTGVIRVQDVVRQTLGRFAQPAEGLIPPGILGHDPGRRKKPLTIEAARALIEECNLSLPIELHAVVHPFLQDRYSLLLEAMRQLWNELQVKIVVETPTMDDYHEKRQNNDGMDLLIGRWVADYDDPDDFSFGLFHSHLGRLKNFFPALNQPKLDEMLETGRQETKPATRERIYRKIEAQLLDTHFVLPLFHDIDYRVAAPSVQRLALRSTPPYVNYSEIAKEEKSERRPQKRDRGGVIQVPVVSEIQSLDPSLTYFVWQSEIIPTIYETLTRQTEAAQTIPWLAGDFQAEDGGKQFHFRLRDNVRFHDGRPLTARDVRYSFERLLSNKASQKQTILLPIRGACAITEGVKNDLEGFRIHSADKFTLDLEEPIPFYPTFLTYGSAAIVPEGTEQFGASWRGGTVGTGPFRVNRFIAGERLELEANPYYWRQGYPKCDSLTFTFGVTPPEIHSGFRSGRFSLASDLFPADVETLRRESQTDWKYGEMPRLSTYYLALNIFNGPLADISLRRRLVETVPVETLVRQSIGRLAIPARGLIPPGLPGFEFATAKAPRVKDEAQRGIGKVRLRGLVHSIYEGPYSTIASGLFAVLRDAGFEIEVVDRSEKFNPKPKNLDFDLNRWIADYPDPDNFIESLLHSRKGLFAGFSSIPEIDDLLQKGRIEKDPGARDDIYREIQSLIAERVLLLPLFHEQVYRFARPEVEGFEVNFHAPVVAYEKLWLRE